MRILLTNDDGITAPGIVALHDELTRLGEVLTIAPLTVQSASSHGVTFAEPLMTREVRVNERMKGIGVEGRPADCVKLAITNLWPQLMGGSPDLVVSGINSGANVGINVIYSGTVAAAIEAAFLGIPAIACSLHLHKRRGADPDDIEISGQARYDVAARHCAEVIALIIRRGVAGGISPHTLLNINCPVTEEDSPRPPVRVVPMNLGAIRDQYERRLSPTGQVYYWASGHGLDFTHTSEGSDVEAIFDRCIAVTPLHFDLTDHAKVSLWRERLLER